MRAVYIADDGASFDTEEQCKTHEALASVFIVTKKYGTAEYYSTRQKAENRITQLTEKDPNNTFYLGIAKLDRQY